MKKVVVGCDPDSNKSGFSVYVDGVLVRLGCYSLIDFYQFLDSDCETSEYKNTELHIENVKGNRCSSFNWIKPRSNTTKEREMVKKINAKISERVGLCKQAQSEIERIADYFGIKIVHHKVSKQWKDSKTGKLALERNTGWTGQSNEDTRSAAYFGFIGSRP